MSIFSSDDERAYLILKTYFRQAREACDDGRCLSEELQEMFHDWWDDPHGTPAKIKALDRLLEENENHLAALGFVFSREREVAEVEECKVEVLA